MVDERSLEQLLADFRIQTGLELIGTYELLKQKADANAVEPLIRILAEIEEGSDREDCFDLITSLLAKIGDPRAILPIINILHRIDFKNAWDLIPFGQAATPFLLTALKSEYFTARDNAAILLANPQFRTEQVIPALVEVALNKTENVRIRSQAIYDLEIIGDRDVIPLLIPLENDPDESIRNGFAELQNKI